MNKNECRLERVSNITIGLCLTLFGFLFIWAGVTVLPVLGFLIAVPVLIIAGVFLASPRSKACAIFARKSRSLIDR